MIASESESGLTSFKLVLHTYRHTRTKKQKQKQKRFLQYSFLPICVVKHCYVSILNKTNQEIMKFKSQYNQLY